MINEKLFNPDDKHDARLLRVLAKFKRIYETYKADITQFTYFELWERAGKQPELAHWKTFYTDKRVQEWYKEELDLAMDARIHKLVRDAGTKNAVGSQQTLTSLLKLKESSKKEKDPNKFFIYSHIPLTNVEKHIKNVKTLSFIPKEIGDSITVFDGSQKSKE